jgi:perosamine synthetase
MFIIDNLINFLKSKKNKYPAIFNFLKYLHDKFLRRFNLVPSYPRILSDEINAAAEVLRTPYWNMCYGKNLVHEKLEEKFAQYVGTKYAVAVNSGGIALLMALRALNITPGNEVIHQVDTCVANAFAAISAGATPVFADISLDTLMLSRESLENAISAETKAIIPVHMWGNSENIDMVSEVAQKHNLTIIEDACLALGAEWKGKKVGGFGKIGIFSFGCMKPIQSGEGGMIVTDDENLYKELITIRSWGDTSAAYGKRDFKTLSFNGRLSEILAAVILEQLKGYPVLLTRIRETVSIFRNKIAKIEGIRIVPHDTSVYNPCYSQVVTTIDEKIIGLSKNDLMKELSEAGINTWHANFEPINKVGFFKDGNWKNWILKGDIDKIARNYSKDFNNSYALYDSIGLGFAKDNFLSESNMDFLVNKLEHIFSRGGKCVK